MDPNSLKLIVQEKYGQIARGQKSCCGESSCCESADYSIFSEDYSKQIGYLETADLNLGCGIPTSFAAIQQGNAVLDLGSGAGNDCFVASRQTGESGRVTGLDFTEAMVLKARENLSKTRIGNIEFVQGDIEAMPFEDNSFDVVISNCVLNLVPNKTQAFSEIHRVLKPGGHFCISDVVIKGSLPQGLREDAEYYAGCVSGAISHEYYLGTVEALNFVNIQVLKEKKVNLPPSVMGKYFSTEQAKQFEDTGSGIFSITLFAQKPKTA